MEFSNLFFFQSFPYGFLSELNLFESSSIYTTHGNFIQYQAAYAYPELRIIIEGPVNLFTQKEATMHYLLFSREEAEIEKLALAKKLALTCRSTNDDDKQKQKDDAIDQEIEEQSCNENL